MKRPKNDSISEILKVKYPNENKTQKTWRRTRQYDFSSIREFLERITGRRLKRNTK